MIIVRYADDLIVGFEHESDARRFLDENRRELREASRSMTFGQRAIHMAGKTRDVDFIDAILEQPAWQLSRRDEFEKRLDEAGFDASVAAAAAGHELPWRCAKAKVTQTIGPATPRVLALPRAGAGSPGGDLRPPPSGRFSNDWR
jgi:hypothetical protein